MEEVAVRGVSVMGAEEECTLGDDRRAELGGADFEEEDRRALVPASGLWLRLYLCSSCIMASGAQAGQACAAVARAARGAVPVRRGLAFALIDHQSTIAVGLIAPRRQQRR